MKNNTFKLGHLRGFTLIELLVVIAIIGILASVVLASLNTARDKGNESKISAQFSGVRSSAEIYFGSANDYGTADNDCAAAVFADVASGMSALADTANYPSGVIIECEATGTAYAMKGTWTDGSAVTKYWCVDSTGASRIADTTDMLIGTDADCDDDDV